MASTRRSRSSRSSVTGPRTRIARPGPGKGCRPTISSGRPSSRPTCRTSSLNNSRSGSMSFHGRLGGRPPTLWWVLMVADGPPLADVDSMTSGYSVPCTRNPTLPASFFLGIFDVLQFLQEPVRCIHDPEVHAEVRAERVLDLFALPAAQQPVVDEDARQAIPDGAVH